MNEITLLLQSLAAVMSSVGQGLTLYGWLAATIRKRGQEKKADEIAGV